MFFLHLYSITDLYSIPRELWLCWAQEWTAQDLQDADDVITVVWNIFATSIFHWNPQLWLTFLRLKTFQRWTAMVIALFYLKIRIWDWSLWSYEITVNMLFSPFVHETYIQRWLQQCIFSLNLSEPSAKKYSNLPTILLTRIMHKKVCFRV